ncbi:MAG: hypothetical protein KKB21_05265 [Nanoarchaeota archaeon]|nr:hypothetical protein [Nanoarchaeota archaeon]MBU4086956.1 hypothetical protein [Nanoarchaeota archaeon]
MEKDVGKIAKNSEIDIVVRIDDYGGKKGLTIREFVSSEKYTGFTKSGTRIPAEKFLEFREMINSISLDDMKQESGDEKKESAEDSEEGLL